MGKVTEKKSYIQGASAESDSRCVGGNFGVILVRVCEPVFKPTPVIYLAFEKNDLFIYLIEHIHLLFFDFYIPSV